MNLNRFSLLNKLRVEDIILYGKRHYFTFSILAMFLVGFVSHYITFVYYQNTENRVLEDLSQEFIDKTTELDAIVDKIKDIEDMFGVEYENELDSDNFGIVERIDGLKDNFNVAFSEKMIKESMPIGYPLKDLNITDIYGVRMHPILKYKHFHRGVDFSAPTGTNVFATSAGVVRIVNEKDDYGKYVILQHNFGFDTAYAHLDKIMVKPGDILKKGDIVGLSGNTGRSTGPHLHYEVRFGGQAIKPVFEKRSL